MSNEMPQSLDLNLNRTNLLIRQRCGNCKHLKRIANPSYGKLCKDLGVLDISKPCERFSTDPTKLKFKGERHARYATDIMQDLSDDKLLLYASSLVEEVRTRRYGFHFGMTVYILAFGSDCLDNYRRLKVISADSKYVNLQAGDFTAMVYHKSVLTPSQWLKKKKWLIENERIHETSHKKRLYERKLSSSEVKAQRAKLDVDAMDYNMTDSKKFAISSGRLVTTKKVFSDPSKYHPIDQLIKTR